MPRLSASTKRRKPSFPESGKIPTLGQMVRDARADQQVIRRATQQALRAWFRQSERLNVARREYRLRGHQFTDFARRIGITDQTSAYHLVHLHRYRAQIIGRCVDDAADAAKRGKIYRYLGWETAFGWFQHSMYRQAAGPLSLSFSSTLFAAPIFARNLRSSSMAR